MSGTARYEATFARLAAGREGAFVPFVVLGDPDPETSLEIVRTLARSGADALELGIPFSDPVADGPAIQRASVRALSAGTRVEDCWRILARVRDELPALPVGLLVYANLVLHAGADAFYARASAAGIDSILVADAPLLESAALERSAEKHGIAPVLIASPNLPDDRLRTLVSRSRGYIYVTSRSGITGVETAGLREDAAAVLRGIRALATTVSVPPALLGFGIAHPEHARRAIRLGAAGAISGSAIALRIERHLDDGRCASRDALLTDVGAFVRTMKAALA